MQASPISYRSFLKETLAERVRKNPAYSLRAFARQLGLASSSLCEVMKGRTGLSLESAQRVAHRLELSDADSEYFCLLVQVESARSGETREVALRKLRALRPEQAIHDLTVDTFRSIADWYHSAILELTFVDGFELEPRKIARKLGITLAEAELALERLLRLELLEKAEDGKLRKTASYMRVQSAVPNEALRKHYRQMLEKAFEAVDAQSPDRKVSGWETMPFSAEVLPQAKEITERYFNEMLKLSRSTSPRTSVYHLAVHFFDLTPDRKSQS